MSERKWAFKVGSNTVYSDVQHFDPLTPIEVSGSYKEGEFIRICVNGVITEATPAGSVSDYPNTLYVGAYWGGATNSAWMIFDELALFARALTEDELISIFRKQAPIDGFNRVFKYTGTLETGDILTVDTKTKKALSRVELYDASTGLKSSVMSNSTVLTSYAPVLTENGAVLYVPTGQSHEVKVEYEKRWL